MQNNGNGSSSKIAQYKKVQNDLRRGIITGKYEVGDFLPSENELSANYGITRMTVRNALKNLEAEGLIQCKKGKGSLVKLKRKSFELLSIKGFTEIMRLKEAEIDTLFVQHPISKAWDDDFFWDLNPTEKKAGCYYMSRVRMLDNQPIMLENTYLPNLSLIGFSEATFVNNSLFDTLIVKYDIEMTGVTQKFRAISADAGLANSLSVQEGTPVLEITRKLKTNREGFFVYSFAYCITNEFMIEA